jgi:hypothetical protein
MALLEKLAMLAKHSEVAAEAGVYQAASLALSMVT